MYKFSKSNNLIDLFLSFALFNLDRNEKTSVRLSIMEMCLVRPRIL